MLRIEHLQVKYGHVEAVRDVSLEVGPKEIVAVLGANGAGKSSLLMAISGLAPIVGGTISWQNERLDHLAPETIVARGIVHVPEGRRMFAQLTVRENLGLGAYAHGHHTAAELDRVWSLFPVLKDRQRQLAGALSGGEQQMLAIARGLMARPKLLILDEPSLGLAPKIVTQLFELLRAIHQDGLPILLVEQNAYQALHLADRGYVLETGRLVISGDARTLSNDPTVKAAYLGA